MPIEKITVLGQGLAGSLLSFELWRRGMPFQVADPGPAGSASSAASGLFAPVTGQRTALMWKAEELLAAARESYRAMEAELGAPFFFELPLLRIFTGQEQKELYLKRAAEAAHRPYLGPLLEPGYFKNLGLDAPWGGMEVKKSGRLDVQGLLQAWRKWLSEKKLLLPKAFAKASEVRGRVVDCRGLAARSDTANAWIPFQPAKGESLLMRGRGPGQGTAFYGRHFALPLGTNRWRVGATYDRADSSLEPTAPKLSELKSGAKALFGRDLDVESQQAGLRPNVLGHFPILGPQKGRPGHFVFNGLGSKGVLWAPWCAKALASHVASGIPIPPEVHSERFHAQKEETAEEKSQAEAAPAAR